jgi:putative SOS response-associated peptidase YedK
MCFHTKQSQQAQALETRFKAKFEKPNLFLPTSHFNGFSFPKTPVITNENRQKIEMIQWGLLPQWANQDFDKTNTLNARIETLSEKKSFRNCINNRCIILVDGFFEWQQIGAKKRKYEIGINNKAFAFAGLFDINNNCKTYTIITTQAQGIMVDIHNTKKRMPVVLNTDSQFDDWLFNQKVNPFYDFTTVPGLFKQNILF